MITLHGTRVAESMETPTGCEGVSTKEIFYSGKAQVAKEQAHVNYDKSEEKQAIDSIQGKWIGFKFVMATYSKVASLQ